ncbi:MAG: polysaccharide biosynthesis protein [Bacteroidales bacterium]|nr:polysaccharide biosynthesis protein [Bacteroidales bacterium]MBP5396324.1 polysaccharide biosynthesis protein [Bacteroidales bacterium]
MKSIYNETKNAVDKVFFRFWRRIVKSYVNNSFSRVWVFVFDIVMVMLAFICSRLVFRSIGSPSAQPLHALGYMLSLVAVYSVSFLSFNTFKGMLRYSGFGDIRRIMLSSLISLILLCGFRMLLIARYGNDANLFFPQFAEIIHEVLMIFFVLVISRLAVRRLFSEYNAPKKNNGKKKALVFGAGSGGVLTYNLISNDKESEYEIVAFVDDNFKKAGSEIQGVPVMLPSKVMRESYIQRHHIEVLIIAIPSLNVDVKNKLAEQALSLNLKVKIIPHVYELIEGQMKSMQIKDIQIEDLLGRDPIVLENEAISEEINGKVILVTGSAGSIGSEIVRQVMNYEPSRLVVLDMGESPVYDIQYELGNSYPKLRERVSYEVADVRDAVRMERIFEQYRPDVVFHAAAYKHVPLMEGSPYEAVRTNVFGSKLIADLSIRYHVKKMVMISTDKAVNPTNVMGATKRIAEIYVQSRRSETQFVTTRFGNVLGSNGSVVPLFKKQLESGGPLTVTDKRITRYFMTIPEACNLVLQAATIANGGEIFVFDMGKPVRIYDLATKMIRLSGRDDVKIEEVGLRPGEKLYEELLATKEDTMPTVHGKIFRAKVRPQDPDEVDAEFEALHKALLSMDEFAIVSQMKAIVPEFKSNNSRFTALDVEPQPSGPAQE